MKRSPMHARRRNTGPSVKTRAIVRVRDRWQCVSCGLHVMWQPHDLQHRVSRGMGGTSDPAANSPVNLIVLCQPCHRRVESRIDPEDNAKGYWLRMNEDPALIPVMYFDQGGSGFTAWLLEDGTFSFEAPGAAA